MKNRKISGISLLEIIVASAIFLAVFMFVISNGLLKMKEWGNFITKESLIQPDIRRAQEDIAKTVINSTWERFLDTENKGIYYFVDDYRHPLVLESSMNNDGTYYIDNDLNPHLKRYVLYFIVRPPDDKCMPNNPIPNPDGYCPHKWLVKKELDPVSLQYFPIITAPMLDVYMSNDLKDKVFGNIWSAKIVAENVLNFEIIPPLDGNKYTIYYNGMPKKTNSKTLEINLTYIKNKKILTQTYYNENLLNKKNEITTLKGYAEPRN